MPAPLGPITARSSFSLNSRLTSCRALTPPKESEKFQDPEFQNYAERTIKNDLPSHIIPHIYWLEKDIFCPFQILFREWLHTLCVFPFLNKIEGDEILYMILINNYLVMLLNILNLTPLAEKLEIDLGELI